MNKTKTRWERVDGPYPCYFNCGAMLSTKRDRQAVEGWEWFTGYGAATVHFCPKCFPNRRQEVEAIRATLNIKPDGYPNVRRLPNGGTTPNSAPSE